MCDSVLISGHSSLEQTVRSSFVSITSIILLADAALFEYITNILVTVIIAIEISVKYCINAITVSGSD